MSPDLSKDVPVSSGSRPPATLFFAVALIAAAVLGFEVALTRVFAVLLRYQFAFLVISLALCGLGLGGLWAHKRRNLDLSNTALFFGFSVAGSLWFILRVVFAHRPDQFWIAALVVLIPFGAAGAFLAATFSRYSQYGGALYGYDLAGAALAAAGSVILMQWVGAIEACLVFGAMGALAGALTTRKPAFTLIISSILLLLAPYNSKVQLWSVQPIPPMTDKDGNSLADRGVVQPLFNELYSDKSDPRPLKDRSKIIDTRWSAFARTDVVSDPVSPDSYLLYTNGNVPTNMMQWDGKLWTLPSIVDNFPLSDWTFHYSNLRDANVLSIGPGGGLDALLAIRYGAKRFDGAEINPSIVGLMKEPGYSAYNGGIYSHPNVHVQTAEGRAFVREGAAKGNRYKLVFSALTKTATAGQGTALLESFIYTSDAFNDYMNALDDDGQLAIVGDAPGNTPLLLARLFSTAMAHFKAQGMDDRTAGTHIAAVYYDRPGPYQWSLLVRKTPFPAAQVAAMAEGAKKANIFPLWLPGQAANNDLFPIGSLASGTLSLDGFIQSGRNQGFNLAPCPDDRPFVLDLGTSPFSIFAASPSLSILLGLSVLATIAFAGFLLVLDGGEMVGVRATFYFLLKLSVLVAIIPASVLLFLNGGLVGWRATFGIWVALSVLGLSVLSTIVFAGLLVSTGGKVAGFRSTFYFLALGVGFMLVEIPLIQKLILPLGYPTLSLTIILFSLLLGGGAGATFSQRFDAAKLRGHALKCALGVAFGALLFGFLSGPLSGFLLGMALPLRCAIAIILLLPLGFLMGTPFPSGLRLFSNVESNRVPLIWALNGTASVAGSIAAAILAKSFGFGIVLDVGALIYLGAAALLVEK